jgi:4-amino-4-deoxy-L-arabinose transferase-like glycosyltransferase
MFAIALPWYIWAEVRTPGFLNYFIIGEHFERYLIPGWEGDLYGAGRGGARGIIWAYYILGLFPWLFYLLYKLFNKSFRQNLLSKKMVKDEKLLYILLWIIAPLVFFTFSGNVLSAYVLHVLLPSAIILAYLICSQEKSPKTGKFIFMTVFNVVLLIAISVAPLFAAESVKSDKFIIDKYKATRESKDDDLIYLTRKIRYSAAFYSDREIVQVLHTDEILDYFKEHKKAFIVVSKAQADNKDLWKGLSVEPLTYHKGKALLKVTKE